MAATIFQAFRIMFGLIIAGFVIYFFLTYAGQYAEAEEDKIKTDIIKNFITAVADVHRTNVPVTFTQFAESGLEFDLSFDADYNPPEHYPGIISNVPTRTMLIPILLVPGDKIYIYRQSVDLGWWNFYFIEALSDVAVIFVLDDTNEVLEIAENIVSAMPSTSDVQALSPKVTFGFCDGHDLYYNDLCDGHRCEMNEFLQLINSGYVTDSSSPCTAELPYNTRLVTISDSCSQTYAEKGICIRTPDILEVGYAYIAGSSESYVYKNRFGLNKLDLLALITGGDEDTIYGITGENYYEYANDMFTEFITTASEMMANRAELLAGEPGTDPECVPLYSTLALTLTSIKNMLVSNPEYYKSHASVDNIYSLFEEAETQYYSLVGKGCEI